MPALITSVEHALATAASDTVKVAKFVEAAVLPVLKKAQADQSSRDGARQPQAANIERAGAVLTSSPSPEFEVGVSARLEGINNPTVVNVTSPPCRSGSDYSQEYSTHSLSFISQRHHRIHLGCPSGREVAGEQGYAAEHC